MNRDNMPARGLSRAIFNSRICRSAATVFTLLSAAFWAPAGTAANLDPGVDCVSSAKGSPNNLSFQRNCEMGHGINLGIVLDKEIAYESDCAHLNGSKRRNKAPGKPDDSDVYLTLMRRGDTGVTGGAGISYLKWLKSIYGLGHIRLPVAWWHHRCDDGNIDPVFMGIVASVVDNALDAGLVVVLNLHEFNKELQKDPTSDKLREDFVTIWRQVSTGFAGRSERLYFELLNEPKFDKLSCKAQWPPLIEAGIAAIRASHKNNTRRTLLLGACNPNDAGLINESLAEVLPKVRGQNGMNPLIATFHTYDPDAAARWIDNTMERNPNLPPCPPLDPTAKLPQPVPLKCASTNDKFKGDWEQFNGDSFKSVATFGKTLDVPIHLGEFGFQRARQGNPRGVGADARNQVNQERDVWLRSMAALAKHYRMSRTIWNLYGQFGFVDHDGETQSDPTGAVLRELLR